MKKILMLATAAFLISGVVFSQDNGGKEKAKAKDKKTCNGKCCKKNKKDGKATSM